MVRPSPVIERGALAKARSAIEASYSRADLISICGLKEGHANRWTKRGIISTSKAPGSGQHRRLNFGNLVEAIIARQLATQHRIEVIERVMAALREGLAEQKIEIGSYDVHRGRHGALIFVYWQRQTGQILGELRRGRVVVSPNSSPLQTVINVTAASREAMERIFAGAR